MSIVMSESVMFPRVYSIVTPRGVAHLINNIIQPNRLKILPFHSVETISRTEGF